MKLPLKFVFTGFLLLSLSSCEIETSETTDTLRIGSIENSKLDEASGIQEGWLNEGIYFLHNDDGEPEIFAIDASGTDLGSFLIDGAKNRDWEDISLVPSAVGPLLLVADSGDNFAKHKNIRLNFVREPVANEKGKFSGKFPLFHSIKLQYPDGARDCESIAYDPSSKQIYLLSKRDKPARIYTITLDDALSLKESVLVYRGEAVTLRPPTSRDLLRFGPRQGQWISQPTGMDISPDGLHAAVITYRSLYIFQRQESETWASAFARKPIEFLGPASRSEESVAYTHGGKAIIVTSEGVRPPVYRFSLDVEN